MAVRGSGDATRRSVIAAAADIVAVEGAGRLTLDAVAERVGLSKGGILHHFATKESLITAMLDEVVANFEVDLQLHLQGESGPGSFARAFLRACLDPDGALTRTLRVSAGILAAVASDRRLLSPLRRRYDVWRGRLENDGIDPAIAELVRSAADGLWLGNVLELGTASAALRQRVFAKLIELTHLVTPPAPGF
jgi:AcrR family transcriptional regulator